MKLVVTTRQVSTTGAKLKLGEAHEVVVIDSAGFFTEFEDVLFNHKSSALLPAGGRKPSDADAEPLEERLGIALIARSLQFLDQTRKQWLVVGHTDTTGGDDYNAELSKQRARCVLGALLGDREMFKTAADGPHLKSKEERAQVQQPDRVAILNWAHEEFAWPCRLEDNFGDPVKAIRDFQHSYNLDKTIRGANPQLDVDGDFGPLTWGAVFDCFQFELGRQLLVDGAGLAALRAQINLQALAALPEMALGCGEHCPIEGRGRDNFRSATNKRVEVLFFDEGEVPVIASTDGKCDQAQSQWYRDLAEAPRFPLPHVVWQFPFHAVQHGEGRTLAVSSPVLTDGEEALVTISQLVNGKEIEVISARPVTISGGQGLIEFPELDNEIIFKEMPPTLDKDGVFVDFSYRAEAKIRGLSFFSRRLPLMRESFTSFYKA